MSRITDFGYGRKKGRRPPLIFLSIAGPAWRHIWVRAALSEKILHYHGHLDGTYVLSGADYLIGEQIK